MTLVDTSVWLDHFRTADPVLLELLEADEVCFHNFVLGELASGNFRNRAQTMSLLGQMPRIGATTDQEVLHFLEEHRLFGLGLGWVDLHLLAAARLHSARFYTKDRNLRKAALRFVAVI